MEKFEYSGRNCRRICAKLRTVPVRLFRKCLKNNDTKGLVANPILKDRLRTSREEPKQNTR